jgi:S1-C subfamily serine protease
VAAGAKGLRDYYGIFVAARTSGAVTDIQLLPRDIIRSINNHQTATLAGLRQQLEGLKPGAPVTLQIQREARLMYVSFTME